MAAAKKSILNITPVSPNSIQPAPLILGVVGKCPACGAPIYGHAIIRSDQEPLLRYSCTCRQGPPNKSFDSTIQYK